MNNPIDSLKLIQQIDLLLWIRLYIATYCLEQIYLLEQILERITWKSGMFKENWFTTDLLERFWLSIWLGGGGGSGYGLQRTDSLEWLSRPSLHIHNRLGVCVCSVFGLVAFGYCKLEKEACYWKRYNIWRTVMRRKIKLSSGATFSCLETTLLVCV